MKGKGFFRALRRFIGEYKDTRKAERREALLYQVFVTDPVDYSLLEKIAQTYEYHFTIKNKDGTQIEMVKNHVPSMHDSEW